MTRLLFWVQRKLTHYLIGKGYQPVPLVHPSDPPLPLEIPSFLNDEDESPAPETAGVLVSGIVTP